MILYYLFHAFAIAENAFLENSATAHDAAAAKKKIKYSLSDIISNSPPYIACPSGAAHMETVIISAIILPTRSGGVTNCTYASICMEKMVEKAIIKKQQTKIMK